MFSSIWKSSSAEDEARIARYIEQLNHLVSCFPIGEKINYYPEYLEDLSLDTMVLGYEVNDRQIYARAHVRQHNDRSVEFFVEEIGETLAAADLASFALIVPDTSDLEKTLNYSSKAVIGRSGQFVRGNSITLVGSNNANGTPILDTAVLRRSKVKEGYYQDYSIVALDPILDSLKNKESRQKNRMELSLACTLFSATGSESSQSCILTDCSELCIGLTLTNAQAGEELLIEGVPVRLSLPMLLLDRSFELTGEIYAIRPKGSVVVKLQRIKKGDEFEELQLGIDWICVPLLFNTAIRATLRKMLAPLYENKPRAF